MGRKRKAEEDSDQFDIDPERMPGAHAIEWVAPDALKPYEQNPRIHPAHQIKQLIGSIKKFGFNVPLIVDAEGELIAGHGRLIAAKEMKLPLVPVIKIEHLTPAQKKAYVIADNRITQNATWNPQVLSQEIQEIMASGEEIKIDELGFSKLEAETLSQIQKQVYGDEGVYKTQGPSYIEQQLRAQAVAAAAKVAPVSSALPSSFASVRPSLKDQQSGEPSDESEEEPVDDSEDHTIDYSAADDDITVPGSSVLVMSEDPVFKTDNYWGFPDFLPNRMAQHVPTKVWDGYTPIHQIPEEERKDYLVMYGKPPSTAPLNGAVMGFYLHDEYFEVIWNDAVKIARRFMSQRPVLIEPDFSFFADDPKCVQFYTHYRSRWLARYWQECGLDVIPNLSWAGPDSYEWVFTGIPVGLPVASVQCRFDSSNPETLGAWSAGIREAVSRVQPQNYLIYGGDTHHEWLKNILPKGPKYWLLPSWSQVRKGGSAGAGKIKTKLIHPLYEP